MHRWAGIGIAALLASVFAVVWLSSAVAVPGSQPMTWQVVGQIGGPTQAVAVQGDYAYVGVGLRLVVLDVSNPITLTEVGSTTPFPYFVEDIVVSGTLAYVAAGGAGLRAVDVSDPANPAELGAWDSPGYAEGVAVAGNTVYLADGPYGLRVVDVSDPAHPVPVGAAYDMNYAFEVAVSGHHAYLAAAGAGLLVADVTDPAHPVEMASLDTPGYAYGVAVSGTLAYIADAWEGLQVADVTDPTNPGLLGACETGPGWALAVGVAGNRAYVANGAGGLRVVDVTNPHNPHTTGIYETSGLFRKIAATGSTVYVADQRSGLRMFDAADEAHPTQVGLYGPLANARYVTVDGSYAYVAAGFSGLRVVDIFDPTRPREIAAYDTEGGYAASIVVSGTHAYLATYLSRSWGLHVFDISDPANPKRIAYGPTPWGAYREIALQGDTLYIADEWGLSLIDVSNPAAPGHLGSIRLNQNEQDTVGVAVQGSLAYVADAGDGVKIVDVSDPAHLSLVGVYRPPVAALGVAVAGETLYVAAHGDGLRIVDVSNPAAPVELGSYDTPGMANSVSLAGSHAYVVDDGGGMWEIDVSNPISPTLVAAYDTPGLGWQADLVGDVAYVADGRGGLLILERTAGGATGGSVEPLLVSDPDLTTAGAPREPRRVTSASQGICVVTSTADSGPGTLRQCLLSVASGDVIAFDPVIFSPTSPMTISLLSPLPWLSQGQVTVDASNAGVILDGSSTPAGTHGLVIASDSNIIQGLQILHFPGNGVNVQDAASYNRIGGNRLQGSGPVGQGNLLSGNGGAGLMIGGSGAMSNTVTGNFIGTDSSGERILPNDRGVGIGSGASYNVVGGLTPGERNLISGNRGNQVELWDAETQHNIVRGNLVGTDASGAFALQPLSPTGGSGVALHSGARHNVIGPANVIAGVAFGVAIGLEGTNDNIITGNLIGTDVSGNGAIGNYYHGVSVSGGAQRNRIGPANRIAYNGGTGVLVDGAATLSNTITANAIYKNATEGIATNNGGNASLTPPILFSASITTVVGVAPPGATVEVFSDWEDEGKVYEGQTTAAASGAFTFTLPSGLVGPNVTATATDAAGNTSEFSAPVLAVIHTGTLTVTSPLDGGPGTLRQAILDAWPGNTITFDPAVFPPTSPVTISLSSPLPAISQGYVTIDASDAGVILDGSALLANSNGLVLASDHNVVRGLRIVGFGVGIDVNGRHNVVGGDRMVGTGPTGQGNVVSRNSTGIALRGDDARHNILLGNLVGTDANGLAAWPNEIGIGVYDAARYNRVGGTTPGERNVVAGNSAKGIDLLGEGVMGNVVAGNQIGTDITGHHALGNGRGGIIVECGASGNIIGGRTAAERNLISGQIYGVTISDWGTANNQVIGNWIGTDATGTAPLPNHVGISICMSGYNRVGGSQPGEGNVISGNTGPGVTFCSGGENNNLVLGNRIGTDVGGISAVGNGEGVDLNALTCHVLLGGATAEEANVISGNQNFAVQVVWAGVDYNFVLGNVIGTDASGSVPLGNGVAGIVLWEHSAHTFVQGNTLAFNGGGWEGVGGVYVNRSMSNTFRRNSIHSNGARGIVLTNGGNQMLPAPLILTVTETSVSGTACPGCTVEVFSDAEDEGRVYEGSAVASAAGTFSFTKPTGLTGPFITATATDGQGNTSEFSAPQRVWNRLYLPMVLKG